MGLYLESKNYGGNIEQRKWKCHTPVTFLQHDMGTTSFDIMLLDMAIQEVKICGLTLVGVAIG